MIPGASGSLKITAYIPITSIRIIRIDLICKELSLVDLSSGTLEDQLKRHVFILHNLELA